jgi:hypothetical protein
MRQHLFFVSVVLMMCCLSAKGKDKKKNPVPDDVLQAKTVVVVIDPGALAGRELLVANQKALENTEKALTKWGRLALVKSATDADLIVTVRAGMQQGGSGRMAGPRMGETTDSGLWVGGSQVSSPQAGSAGGAGSEPAGMGRDSVQTPDFFAIYRGKRENPLSQPAVWKYGSVDALRAPDVPAVAEFRKLIEETEKEKSATPH